MLSKKLKIIVGGYIGIFSAGGVTWDYIQYLLGLRKLGHEVYYLEDTKLYPVYTFDLQSWNNPMALVKHLENVMTSFNFKESWIYRDESTGQIFGMPKNQFDLLINSADVFINISCSTTMREEYARIPIRIVIDSDPMFTQIQYNSEQLFTDGQPTMKSLIDSHTHHFTFGENLHHADCLIPTNDLHWITTRQPICMDYWPASNVEKNTIKITTLMNWAAGKPLYYNKEYWGQKNIEFDKIMTIPQFFPHCRFSLAINETGTSEVTFPQILISKHGWEMISPMEASGTYYAYQDFIYQSSAELSIVKNTYAKAVTGWFSCRSACYLAAGRPVILQETGWSRFLPTGKGLFSFRNAEEARENLSRMIMDIDFHSKEARNICNDYFNSDIVLSKLLSYL